MKMEFSQSNFGKNENGTLTVSEIGLMGIGKRGGINGQDTLPLAKILSGRKNGAMWDGAEEEEEAGMKGGKAYC